MTSKDDEATNYKTIDKARTFVFVMQTEALKLCLILADGSTLDFNS